MTMRRRVFVVASAALLAAGGCSVTKITDPGNSGLETRRTFPAVWINASWTNGATGLPSRITSQSPATPFGQLCTPSQIVLENHTTKYANVPGDILLVGNGCSFLVAVAVCQTFGATGSTASQIPYCDVEPRLTTGFNLSVQRIIAANTAHPFPFGATPQTLEINLFFCSDGSDFNFAQLSPVKNIAPTDCVELK